MGLADRDRQELTDLIVEFAWRVDHRLASSIHELVADDVEMTLTNGRSAERTMSLPGGPRGTPLTVRHRT